MADISDGSLAGMIKDGGVVVFAIAVLLFLRDFRRELVPVLKDMVTTNTEVKAILSALLERERMRAAAALVRQPAMYPQPVDQFLDGETPPLGTHVEQAHPPQRRTPPGGYPVTTTPQSYPVTGGYSQHRRKTEGGG